MIDIDLNNINTDFSKIKKELELMNNSLSNNPKPSFHNYEPNLERIFELASKFANTKNFIVLGRGGSVTGIKTIYNALAKYYTNKNLYVIDTIDPEYINYVKKKCSHEDSVVIAISKSGNTVDVLENLFCFQEYSKIIVTQGGTLLEIAKNNDLELVNHPDVGGRFSAGTESALLVAALIYVDIKQILEGMNNFYNTAQELKKAKDFSAALYLAEKEGYDEVYAPVYNESLSESCELWTQLMHESVCKNKNGQTFLFMRAPECQHHSNQRYFDGKKNILGLFTRVKEARQDITLELDYKFADLEVKGFSLKNLDKESLQEALTHEYTGVKRNSDDLKIPNITLTIDKISPFSLGELIAFWNYTAVYSSYLRGVNPFNQPGVEDSKNISIAERKKN